MSIEHSVVLLEKVFKSLHEINNLLSAFNVQATLLKEVSVNSAIAAGHVEVESQALSEIAKQIAYLAKLLMEAAAEANHTTSKISNAILCSIVDNNKIKMMLLGLERMDSSTHFNVDAINEVVCQLECKIMERRKEAEQMIHSLAPFQGRIKQIIQRIWSIVVSLKVLSGEDNLETSFFLPIAHSLQEIADKNQLLDDHLRKQAETVSMLLTSKIDIVEKEINYAA